MLFHDVPSRDIVGLGHTFSKSSSTDRRETDVLSTERIAGSYKFLEFDISSINT